MITHDSQLNYLYAYHMSFFLIIINGTNVMKSNVKFSHSKWVYTWNLSFFLSPSLQPVVRNGRRIIMPHIYHIEISGSGKSSEAVLFPNIIMIRAARFSTRRMVSNTLNVSFKTKYPRTKQMQVACQSVTWMIVEDMNFVVEYKVKFM